MKIIIADDDPLIIELLSEYLVSAGHEVSSAYDAPTLVSMVQQDPPGLVFFDINMPGIRDGGMSSKVTIPSELRGIPLVAITGNEKEKVYQMGLPQSIEVLQKPINFTDVEAVIEKAAGGN
jgi:two-component system, OmpR family, response regulator